ncbi:DUF1609 domain-containing protein [Encephalitozoon cuniculi]|nr:DUF1609 domain-containing protein [Encephalitozoon cuniculi]UYI26921.1 DUF1609 domain-containing protein [Encephalitozoon cuniculi]UYI27140.1 DUF1609 domain-containing protein [Encephalitozoon cuniculi]UYI27563.1 DUF1609 domain-containing protein [Encephalitozoon cuniculi]UYI27968.1 DUF1609 domain-containing protein [Encephalitozoon cuniculi]
MPSVEVGGARRKTGKKSRGGQKRFRIHRRVLRWRAQRRSRRSGTGEARRGGRSLEEIRSRRCSMT